MPLFWMLGAFFIPDLLLFRRLNGNEYFHLPANDAHFKKLAVTHVIIQTVDGQTGFETGHLLFGVEGVVLCPEKGNGHLDATADVFDGHGTVQHIFITSGVLDGFAFEPHLRVSLLAKEIIRLQVAIPFGIVGIDTVHLYRRLGLWG